MDIIMDSITGITTTDKDRSFWQIFLDGVTGVLNFDTPTVIKDHRGDGFNLHKKDVRYTSFIDHSNHELCFGLQELLSNSREMANFRITPQSEIRISYRT